MFSNLQLTSELHSDFVMCRFLKINLDLMWNLQFNLDVSNLQFQSDLKINSDLLQICNLICTWK